MYKVAVLTRNFEQYRRLFERLLEAQPDLPLQLDYYGQNPQEQIPLDTQILLANPNYAAQVVDRLPNLAWLQSTWAGVRPICDQNKRHFQLTGLKNVFGEQMREYTFTHILNHARKTALLGEQQRARQWQQPVPIDITGKTLGISGLGNIGQGVAEAAKAFGMRVISLNASSSPKLADQCFFSHNKIAFAKQCDYYLNLMPDTDMSKGLCDAEFIAALPNHAVLINAGRGSLISDDQMLIDSLDQNQLAHAVLDVFKQEPLPQEHPFWTHEKVTVTQHTAALSTADKVFSVFKRNLSAFIAGKPLADQVDFDKGY